MLVLVEGEGGDCGGFLGKKNVRMGVLRWFRAREVSSWRLFLKSCMWGMKSVIVGYPCAAYSAVVW